MSEVHILPGKCERDPTAMLECAKKANLNSVIIIGWTDEALFISSSYSKNQDILWDIKLVERDLLSS